MDIEKQKKERIHDRKFTRTTNGNNKVDINSLLNRVRADERKKKFETTIFIGLISLSVIVSGIILSFR